MSKYHHGFGTYIDGCETPSLGFKPTKPLVEFLPPNLNPQGLEYLSSYKNNQIVPWPEARKKTWQVLSTEHMLFSQFTSNSPKDAPRHVSYSMFFAYTQSHVLLSLWPNKATQCWPLLLPLSVSFIHSAHLLNSPGNPLVFVAPMSLVTRRSFWHLLRL